MMENDRKLYIYSDVDVFVRIRLGEAAVIWSACYHRAKDLGYKDENIYIEWRDRIKCDDSDIFVPFPGKTIFPFTFVEKEFNSIGMDKIDLFKENSLFNGYKPIQKEKTFPFSIRDYTSVYEYLNIRYYEKGEHSIMNAPKTKNREKYILFHFRDAKRTPYRNADPKIFNQLVDMVKKKFGDKYKYFKIGEPQRMVDKKFDFVAPNYRDNISEFFRIINDAEFMICASSGPNIFGQMLGIPTIEYEIPLTDKLGGFFESHTEGYWNKTGGKIGKTAIDWVDKDRYKMLLKGNVLNESEIINFMEKWV